MQASASASRELGVGRQKSFSFGCRIGKRPMKKKYLTRLLLRLSLRDSFGGQGGRVQSAKCKVVAVIQPPPLQPMVCFSDSPVWESRLVGVMQSAKNWLNGFEKIPSQNFQASTGKQECEIPGRFFFSG